VGRFPVAGRGGFDAASKLSAAAGVSVETVSVHISVAPTGKTTGVKKSIALTPAHAGLFHWTMAVFEPVNSAGGYCSLFDPKKLHE
jgi:hypothetical protein